MNGMDEMCERVKWKWQSAAPGSGSRDDDEGTKVTTIEGIKSTFRKEGRKFRLHCAPSSLLPKVTIKRVLCVLVSSSESQ